MLVAVRFEGAASMREGADAGGLIALGGPGVSSLGTDAEDVLPIRLVTYAVRACEGPPTLDGAGEANEAGAPLLGCPGRRPRARPPCSSVPVAVRAATGPPARSDERNLRQRQSPQREFGRPSVAPGRRRQAAAQGRSVARPRRSLLLRRVRPRHPARVTSLWATRGAGFS